MIVIDQCALCYQLAQIDDLINAPSNKHLPNSVKFFL